MVVSIIENSLRACLYLIFLGKHTLGLFSEPSGCFSVSLILAPWLWAVPPVANGFSFDCSLNLTIAT